MGNIDAMLVVAALAAATASPAAAHPPHVVSPGGGKPVEVPFHQTWLLLSDQATEGRLSIYEFTLPAGTAGAPPHIHTNEDEYAYVLAGEFSLLVGDEVARAEPGSLAVLTRGRPHAFWNASDREAKALFIVSEGGFERFFDTVAVRLREERPEEPAAANALVARIAHDHGITLRPDLIPAEAAPFFAPPGE